MAAPRPKRADAVRNRERVVAAATTVLAERGLDATVPEIAATAGVGKATVYRSFPTKEHLVAAIAGEHLRALETAYDEAAVASDPVGAMEELIADLLRRQATNQVIAGALAAAVRLPELVATREATMAALERLVAAGRAAGGLRDDVRADDVRVLVTGISRVLIERDEHDPAAWERYAGFVMAALRP